MREALGAVLILVALGLLGFGYLIGNLSYCKPGCPDDLHWWKLWRMGAFFSAPFFVLAIICFWPKKADSQRDGND